MDDRPPELERGPEPERDQTVVARPRARRPQTTTDGDATLPVTDVAEGDASVAAMFRAAGFDRYRAGEVLGIGGMGEVRAHTDQATGRTIAMKTIRKEREEDGLRRFAREARIQAQLEHPAIVPVYDVGVAADGSFYFTMKRVRGDNLGQVLTRLRAGDAETRQRYTPRKLLTVLSTVAMTIEYAHRRGIVHRDLKPSNIMLGAFGEVYVLDWGLADVRDGTPPQPSAPHVTSSRVGIALPAHDALIGPLVDSSLRPNTETGQVLGTPGYAAPEQIRDPESTDHRVDVYALGVMLFEVLTLERLHAGATVAEVFASTSTLDGARARERTPGRDVPPELDALACAATRLDPGQRPPSAAAIARGLEAYLDGDRDLEARRRLAAQAAETASAALVTVRAGGTHGDEASVRALALREVTTALGLDPDNARARGLLVRLLTEPSPGTIAAAEAAHAPAAIAHFRLAARHAILALLTYALYVPLIFWMGLRHAWMLGAMGGSILATIGVTYYYYRHPPRGLRLPIPHLIASTTAMAMGVAMFGPLVLLPSIVIANGVAYLAGIDNRWRAVMVATLAVIVVPVLLQAADLVPPWYVAEGNALRIVPWMVDFPPTQTLVFLTFANAVVIAASLLFVARMRQNGLDAERRLRVQAYQLAQLTSQR